MRGAQWAAAASLASQTLSEPGGAVWYNPDVQRRLLLLGIATAALGCGRTGLPPREALLVQVVNEQDTPIPSPTVSLTRVGQPEFVRQARGGRDGVAEFTFPGKGEFIVKATASACCFRAGEVAVDVEYAGQLVVVETQFGPCPTVVPTWCGEY